MRRRATTPSNQEYRHEGGKTRREGEDLPRKEENYKEKDGENQDEPGGVDQGPGPEGALPPPGEETGQGGLHPEEAQGRQDRPGGDEEGRLGAEERQGQSPMTTPAAAISRGIRRRMVSSKGSIVFMVRAFVRE